MKIGFTAAVLLCLILTGCGSSEMQKERTVFAMDTAVTVKGTEQDIETAIGILNTLDPLFDRYSPTSDIYVLNSRGNAGISDFTRDVIIRSAELEAEFGSGASIFAGDITDAWDIGSDNPKVPSEAEIAAALESTSAADFSIDSMSFTDENGSIDLGSVAKGYALDKINERLSDEVCVVSMTSSVLLHGEKDGGKPFPVSIRNPSDSGGTLGTLRTEECFLSTSGGYERFFEADGQRYIHIFDLSTGRPCESGLSSVTVISKSGIESDFLSTLIFAGGIESLGKFMEMPDLGIIAVTEGGIVYTSPGVDFTLDGDCGYVLEVWKNE